MGAKYTKKSIEEKVAEEIRAIDISQNYTVKIETCSERLPFPFLSETEETRDKLFIEIITESGMNDAEKPERDYLHMDFWYNPFESRIDCMSLGLAEHLRGNGFGRKLVEAMEKIGKDLGCNTVRIDMNVNPSFWKHLNYQDNGAYTEKKL